MQVESLAIEGAWVFTPRILGDERGSFLEWFKDPVFNAAVGHRLDLVQANASVSAKGVLRGIHHADVPPGQAKYVTCVNGSVLDVVVDIRVGSPTFGRWESVLLDDRDRRAVYLSEGLGHGFCSQADGSTVVYLCSEGYNPSAEHEVHPLDPAIGIDWGLGGAGPELSAKDAAAPTLAEAAAAGALPDVRVPRPPASPRGLIRPRASPPGRTPPICPGAGYCCPVRREIRLRLKAMLQPGIDTMGYTAASYVDLKSQANDVASTLIGFDGPPTTPADSRLLSAVRLLRPVRVDHGRLTRVGGEGDGGYVMLAGDPANVAVSIGVGPDVSWDAAIASRGTQVHMFDHTVRRLPGHVPGGTFHRLGVGEHEAGPIRTLASIMAISGVTEGSKAYLKMDVEGAEWSSLAACPPGLLGAFDQIVMELHELDRLLDADAAADVLTALGLLAEDHLPIHLHPNNYARVVRFGSYWFPRAVEVSWVHRRHLTTTAPAKELARHLDRPCDPRVTEVDLSAITRLPAPPPRVA